MECRGRRPVQALDDATDRGGVLGGGSVVRHELQPQPVHRNAIGDRGPTCLRRRGAPEPEHLTRGVVAPGDWQPVSRITGNSPIRSPALVDQAPGVVRPEHSSLGFAGTAVAIGDARLLDPEERYGERRLVDDAGGSHREPASGGLHQASIPWRRPGRPCRYVTRRPRTGSGPRAAAKDVRRSRRPPRCPGSWTRSG